MKQSCHPRPGLGSMQTGLPVRGLKAPLRRNDHGFTLMEILIAMAILGIIAGVGFSAYTISLVKTHDAKRKSDLQTISNALEAYQSDFGVYPASVSDRVAGCGNSNPSDDIDATETCAWGVAWTLDTGKLYLKLLPREQRDNFYYSYKASADQRKFQLFTNLENDNDPGIDNTLSEVCSQVGDLCNYGIASPNATINEVLQ